MSRPKQRTALTELVRARRRELGLTQIEFGEAVEMSQEWASALEQGRVKVPRIETLHRMSDVLKIPVADLIVAANLATSVTEARRVAEAVPAYDAVSPEDTLRRVYPDLSEEEIRFVARMAADLQREGKRQRQRTQRRVEREAG